MKLMKEKVDDFEKEKQQVQHIFFNLIHSNIIIN